MHQKSVNKHTNHSIFNFGAYKFEASKFEALVLVSAATSNNGKNNKL